MSKRGVATIVAATTALVTGLSVAAWAQDDPGVSTASSLRPQSTATTTTARPPAMLRLEPMGDSITWGYQSTTGDGYREDLLSMLAAEGHKPDFVGSATGGTMSDPYNEGHAGWRIDQLAAITDASLATYRPNVVTLMMGTNDLGQNYQVATAPARLKALVNQILKDDPVATVLVANLIVSTNTVVAPARPAYNATIPPMVKAEEAAGKHVVFVSMNALTTADMFDALHPNDTGYQLMAVAWNKAIQWADKKGWIVPPDGWPVLDKASTVASRLADKCLNVSGTGSAVQLYGCNETTSQLWTPYAKGTLQARGKCLDAAGPGTDNGTKVQLHACDGTRAQMWKFSYDTYRNVASGRCLDDPSAANGTSLALKKCNGGESQQWAFRGRVGPVDSGMADECLDDNAGSTTAGAVVDLWACNNSAAQQWSSTGNNVRINGLCLNVTGGATADGALVDLADCNGGTGQVWKTVHDTLVNPASGKCLDDPALSTTNGTQLDIWDCNGGANQEWMPTSF
jgi:lysophospholipase L1-like esterase